MECYCVTKEDFVRLKDTYMKLRNSGELPEPRSLSFNNEEENKTDEGLEFGKKIFGDFLKIKEE